MDETFIQERIRQLVADSGKSEKLVSREAWALCRIYPVPDIRQIRAVPIDVFSKSVNILTLNPEIFSILIFLIHYQFNAFFPIYIR